MRVAVVHAYPDLMGGIERTLHLSVAGLRALGHEVLIVHGGPAGTWVNEFDGHREIPDLFDFGPFAGRRAKRASSEVVDYIRAERVDIVHVHTIPPPGAFRALVQGTPTVVTAHTPVCPNGARYFWTERQVCTRDIGLGCVTEGYRKHGCGHSGDDNPVGLPGFGRAMANAMAIVSILQDCRAVIAPSNWQKACLERDGVPSHLLHVLHPPIDDPDAASGLPSSESETPAVLFVGRLISCKGPDQVLHASARIKAHHEVWFAGEGPMTPGLKTLALGLGISERVKFLGRMDPAQLTELRQRATVGVMPSLWPEVFGMAGAEGIAAGLPVVAYEVGGMTEWASTDGGTLVQPGDIDGLAGALEGALTQSRTTKRSANVSSTDRHAAALASILTEAAELP